MKKVYLGMTIVLLLLLFGCSAVASTNSQTKVGLLLPHQIDDQGWNSKGYQGLLDIQSNLGVDVFYKENINTMQMVRSSVEEFTRNGTTLIFGHGHMYADMFMELKDEYPGTHFVTFNGEVTGENITSLHFKGHAMGFFAGMLASEMTETDAVGVIAAFPWQPEVKGFVEGATYQNKDVNVHVEYASSWVDVDAAKEKFNDLVNKQVDVFYPAGDGFHIAIIEEVKKHGFYAIGFVGDQSDLGQSTVLTSTIQHVDQLYGLVAEKFLKGQLEVGNIEFDFADGVISMGEFSTEVPKELQQMIKEEIRSYIKTGKLPNENS